VQKSLLNLRSSRLLVSFTKPGDRFHHSVATSVAAADEVCCQSGAGPSEAGHSGAGTPQEFWPADPPLQQLVLEDMGSPPRRVALGVGMSGHGHWSLAAEVIDETIGVIQFDWACRIHRAAARLVSTYQLDASLAQAHGRITEEEGQWRLADGRLLIIAVTQGRMRWSPDEGLISIEPVTDIQRIGTHCWRYCFCVE
jgi:hypothetical protein